MRTLWVVIAALGLAACSLYFEHGSNSGGPPDAGAADGGQQGPVDADLTGDAPFGVPDADVGDAGEPGDGGCDPTHDGGAADAGVLPDAW